jgi:electron transport complex protein RnfC
MLMRERAADILRGASILCHALSAAHCTIVIEDDKPQAIQAMQVAQAAHANIEVRVVPAVYPTGGENQLITLVTGLEVPSGGWPSDIGAICHNVGTAAAVTRWVDHGEPLTRRIVTVTGSGIAEAANIDVVLGTSIAEVIRQCGGYAGSVTRLLMGGSMMGQALASDDLPVVKASNCLVVALPEDLQPRGREMPCIRCGNCAESCPAILLPQQLHWFAQSPDLPALDAHGLLDCIECGCCDHVCPSQIPLTQRFREAKPALLDRRAAQTAASLARERYESREARLTRLEQERQAKLAERRKSAGARPTPDA